MDLVTYALFKSSEKISNQKLTHLETQIANILILLQQMNIDLTRASQLMDTLSGEEVYISDDSE